MGTVFSSYGQFSAVYNNDVLSLTGYDIVKLDGQYFYTAGDDNNKVLYEIDPTDGSVLYSSSNIKRIVTTGSRNNIGKNSTQIGHFTPDLQTTVHTGLRITGLRDYTVNGPTFPTYPELNYYHVEDIGAQLVEYGAEEFIPPSYANGGSSSPSLSYVTAYADQMNLDTDADGVEDYMYFTGSVFGPGTRFNTLRSPFVMRHERNFTSFLPQSNYMRVLWPLFDLDYDPSTAVGIPEYTTRIIPGESTLEAFITSGPGIHDGNGGYEFSSTKRGAGVWAVGSNFWTKFCKTYDTGDMEDNLGIAQSIVMSDIEDNTQPNSPLTFIASGDHPNTTSNPQGIWDKDYFHLVKIRSTNGTVLDAKKYTMTDQYPNYTVSYTHVDGSDLIYIPTAGGPGHSNKKGSSGIYAVAGTATKNYMGSTSISLERVFVIVLDKNLNPLHSADFMPADINPADVLDLKVNRIKYMDNDYWIVGSFSSQHEPARRIPFLLRVSPDLNSQCADANITSANDASITVLDRSETLHNYVIGQSPENLPPAQSIQVDDNEVCGEIIVYEDPDPIDPYIPFDPTGSAPFQEPLDLEKDNVNELQVTMSPNPVVNQLKVVFPRENSTTISIIDVTGKSIIEHIGETSGSHLFDVSTLEKGVYFLKVVQGANTDTQKFIKQ